MTTLQLVIVCITFLSALVIAARIFRPAAAKQSGVLAAQVGVAVANRLVPSLELIAEQTAPTERSAPAPSIIGEDVVVHTRKPDAQSVRGIVIGDYADCVILRDAVAMSDGRTVPADGIVHIPRGGVSFIQQVLATDTIA